MLINLVLSTIIFLLKIMKIRLFKCITINQINWGNLSIKFVGSKVVIQISLLNVYCVLLEKEERPFNRDEKFSENLSSTNTSSILKTRAITIMKAVISFFFSSFSVVLTDCTVMLRTNEEDYLQVCIYCFYNYYGDNDDIMYIPIYTCVCMYTYMCICIYV
jgi:hypothetical protein